MNYSFLYLLSLLLSSVAAAFDFGFPIFKDQARKMFFGGKSSFSRKRTPFLEDRYESAKWNYAERNLQGHLERNPHLSAAEAIPFKHRKDHRGNLIEMDILHNTSGMLTRAVPSPRLMVRSEPTEAEIAA